MAKAIKMNMDSGITEQVDSITQEDPFIGVSQKLSCLWEAAGFPVKLTDLAWDKWSLRCYGISR